MAVQTLSFLQFADRCELLGITPEMVYRMADKNKQKKVALDTFKATLNRLNLRLDESTIMRICTSLDGNKDKTLKYDDYMATINAHQI